MVSDLDLSYGIVIAAAILLIAVFVWPGPARAKPGDFAGYWADTAGALYELRQAGGRRFILKGGPALSGRGPGWGRGKMVGLRSVVFGTGPQSRSGKLELGGRALAWKDGQKWYRQGVLRERATHARAPTPGQG